MTRRGGRSWSMMSIVTTEIQLWPIGWTKPLLLYHDGVETMPKSAWLVPAVVLDRMWTITTSFSFKRRDSESNSKLTAADEDAKLIPDIPVSILRLDAVDLQNCTEVLLQQGDVLYLPPRVVHCGTAMSNDCMTLSIGCRAPSAADLVAHLAESMQTSVQRLHQQSQPFAAVTRYTDSGSLSLTMDDDSSSTLPSLSDTAKESMKALVRNSIEELLEDEQVWDELVGKLTTKAMRYSDAIAERFDETSRSYRKTWGDSPNALVQRVLQLGDGASLVRTPGISIATSCIDTVTGKVDRIYFGGEMWECVNDEHAMEVFRRIERGEALNGSLLARLASETVVGILEELVRDGYVQARITS